MEWGDLQRHGRVESYVGHGPNRVCVRLGGVVVQNRADVRSSSSKTRRAIEKKMNWMLASDVRSWVGPQMRRKTSTSGMLWKNRKMRRFLKMRDEVKEIEMGHELFALRHSEK